ncbi:hypothetical protein FOA52_014592 [Chlamydomonas sp. UWO 241]|nr:hypothetical protein FOA52_014592 [Chlamydomonas sp. UWO 241]
MAQRKVSGSWRLVAEDHTTDGLPSQHEQPEEFDPNGARIMSARVVARVLRDAGAYRTPQYNSTLYLNNMRFGGIAHLEEYTGCRTLHLEGNCIKRIEGLGHMSELRSLFIQTNTITCIEGLATCTRLSYLNVSSNPLRSLRGLPPLVSTLHAAGIGLEDASEIELLAQACPSLQVLDLSRNRVPVDALPALCKLESLRVLYLKECPCKRAPDYRRLLVSSLPQLTFLDDTPVDEGERRGAEAWVIGGATAEAAARTAYRHERQRALKRTTTTFAVERALRRVLRELAGSLGDDGQLSWLLQMLEAPLQADSVSALVARLLGDEAPSTVDPAALDRLQARVYVPGGSRTVVVVDGGKGTASWHQVQPYGRTADCTADCVADGTAGGSGRGGGQRVDDLGGGAVGGGDGEAGHGSRSGEANDDDRGGGGEAGSGGKAGGGQAGSASETSDDDRGGGEASGVDTIPGCDALSAPEAGARVGSSAASDECVVCSEELAPGARALWLPCGHVFHDACIRQWLTRFSNTCPTCRARVLPAAATRPAGTAGRADLEGVVDGNAGVGAAAALAATATPVADGGTADAYAVADAADVSAASAPYALTTNRIVLSILTQLAASLAQQPQQQPAAAPSPTGHRGGGDSAGRAEGGGGGGLGASSQRGQAEAVAAAFVAATAVVHMRPQSAQPQPQQQQQNRGSDGGSDGSGADAESVPDAGAAVAAEAAGPKDPGAASSAAPAATADPTYVKLQQLYKASFARRTSRDPGADAALGQWSAMKEQRGSERAAAAAGAAAGAAGLLQQQQQLPKPTPPATPSREAAQASAAELQLQLAGMRHGEGCGGAGGGALSSAPTEAPHPRRPQPEQPQRQPPKQQPSRQPAPLPRPPAPPAATRTAAPHLVDSPVQAIFRAVSNVRQERQAAVAEASGAAGASGPSSKSSAAAAARDAGPPSTLAALPALSRRPPASSSPLTLVLVPRSSSGTGGGDDGEDDLWGAGGMQSAPVPYL